MVSLARFTPKTVWLCVLCALALGLSLAASVLLETADGSLDPLASQPGDENRFVASHAGAFDLMDDSALPVTVGLPRWFPVVFVFSLSRPAEWNWFSTPPVRPPIFSNSI